MKSLQEIAKESFLTEDQLKEIEEIILQDNFFPPETVREEIEIFCTDLGLSEQYFESTPLVTIARHIEALRSAEILARLRGEQEVKIDFATELTDEAMYLVEDNHYRAIEIEEKIEKKYPGFRIQSYRSARKRPGVEYLRWYVVCKPEFASHEASPEETDLKKIADKEFLASIPGETLARYQELMNRAKDPERPYIDVTHVAKDKLCAFPSSARAIPSPDFSSTFLTLSIPTGWFPGGNTWSLLPMARPS